MPAAARVGDKHACPMLNSDESPHVGGPITQGEPTVLIGYMSAARLGDRRRARGRSTSSAAVLPRCSSGTCRRPGWGT